ncbi:MAG: hypothetical protein JWO13_1412 [Acidobacteriales bacterium]|nr:hypothetical protein [Terriglobales bacterium]
MIAELDVTLTDYALAVEATILAYSLYRAKEAWPPLQSAFVLFFSSIGAATLVGGTVHGFFPDDLSRGSKLLWPVTLIILGITSVIVWRLGALLVFRPVVVAWVTRVALIEFVLYSLFVLYVRRDFIIAIANYLPAVLFLTLSFGFRFLRRPNSSTLAGIAGLFLTFVASAVQHFKISLHPRYFNHNAFYHLLQGIALLLIFMSARYLVRNPTTAPLGETGEQYAYKA